MNIALDLILLIIFAAIVIRSYRRGFLVSVFSFASVIISAIAAWIFHSPLADFISSTFLKDSFSDAALEKIRSFSQDGNLGDLFTRLPSEFSDYLTNNGLDPSNISDGYQSGGVTAESYAETLSQQIGSALANLIASAIALILIFALTMVICSIITVFLKAVVKLPILHSLDKLLGLALGLLAALIFAWLFSHCAVSIFDALESLYPDKYTAGTLDQTVLISFFSGFNPFSLLN